MLGWALKRQARAPFQQVCSTDVFARSHRIMQTQEVLWASSMLDQPAERTMRGKLPTAAYVTGEILKVSS